ncbi:MAG: AgmX/PglI C-terminal domain-containing protein [Myxococcales bacterium]|nr:AgmX/PglI C-terminal domain-containing protein [Myxococcales bacterium]
MKPRSLAWRVMLAATLISCGEAAVSSSPTSAPPASSESVAPTRGEAPIQQNAHETHRPGKGDHTPNAEPPASNPAAPSTGTARVIVGGAGGPGSGIPNEEEVVAAMVPALRVCYEHALRDNPRTRGSVRVTAKVDSAGRVWEAKPTNGDGLSPALVSCVVARISAARFMPPSGGSAVVVIPVTFDR